MGIDKVGRYENVQFIMGSIQSAWAFTTYTVPLHVFQLIRLKKETGFSGASMYGFAWYIAQASSLSGSELVSSYFQVIQGLPPRPWIRTHYLLQFLSDLYFLFTSIYSPTSVHETVNHNFNNGGSAITNSRDLLPWWEGATPSWSIWLEVAPEFVWVALCSSCDILISVKGCMRAGVWLWLDFCFLLSHQLLFLLFLLEADVICWTVIDSNLSSSPRILQQFFHSLFFSSFCNCTLLSAKYSQVLASSALRDCIVDLSVSICLLCNSTVRHGQYQTYWTFQNGI